MSNAADSKSQSTDSPQAVKSQDLVEPHATNATSSADELPSGQQPAQLDNGRVLDFIPQMRKKVAWAITEKASFCVADTDWPQFLPEADAAILATLQALIEMELPKEAIERAAFVDEQLTSIEVFRRQRVPSVFREILSHLLGLTKEARS